MQVPVLKSEVAPLITPSRLPEVDIHGRRESLRLWGSEIQVRARSKTSVDRNLPLHLGIAYPPPPLAF
jgi:hypothetical protein